MLSTTLIMKTMRSVVALRALRQCSGHWQLRAAVYCTILLAFTAACDGVISSPDGSSGRVVRAIRLGTSDVTLGTGASKQIDIVILDQHQEPFTDTIPEGTRVEWSSSDTSIVAVSETGVVTARQTGNATIRATLASVIGRPAVSASVLVGTSAQHIDVVSGTEQSAVVGKTLPQPIVVQALDDNDMPVAGVVVKFTVDEHGGTVEPSEAVTNEQGRAQTVWTLGTVAGSVQLEATLADIPGSATYISATALPVQDPGIYRLLVVSGNGQFAPARHRVPEPLVIRLVDGTGQPVSGKLIRWETSSDSSHVEMNGETTDANGELTADWIMGSTSGGHTVTAKTTNVPGDPSVTFTATAGNPPKSFRIVRGEDQYVVRGQPTPEPIVVRVLSFDTLPVRGVRIDWSVNTGDHGTIQVLSRYTDAKGEVKVIYTPNGNDFVVGSFTDPFYGHRSVNVSVNVVIPTAVAGGDGQVGQANDTLPELLQVRVLNPQGEPIVGRRVTWTVTAGGGVVVPVDGGVTDANGIARAKWKIGAAGTEQQVIAKADGITGFEARFNAESVAGLRRTSDSRIRKYVRK